MRVRRRASGALRTAAALCVLSSLLLAASSAQAQKKKGPPPRDVKFAWNAEKTSVSAALVFRDVITTNIRQKLSRGLPTTIVFTATVHRPGVKDPIATTAQTCRITWLVWDEYYRIEITRPGDSRVDKTLTVEGVFRRCAETKGLVVATSAQLPVGAAVSLKAKVQVNPISKDVIKKLKRWVSRPTGTGTAGPSDALFSTFTGLFLQRIGKAEHEIKFTTKTVTPVVPKPKPPKKPKGKG